MPNLIKPDEFINPITKEEFLDLVLNLASTADTAGYSNNLDTEKEIAKFLTTVGITKSDFNRNTKKDTSRQDNEIFSDKEMSILIPYFKYLEN